MKERELDVKDDFILLQQLLDEHGLSAKWLAGECGRSLPHIYRYLAGEATIPVFVWGKLFARTLDLRIIELIRGGAPLVFTPLPAGAFQLDPPTLQTLRANRQREIELEGYLLKILEDGQVTDADRGAIRDFSSKLPQHLASLVSLKHALLAKLK